MAKYTGVVRKSDLEGGLWQLACGDGQTYELEGGDATLRRAGQRVEVEGQVVKNRMSFGMSGPLLAVTSYRVLG